MLSLSVKVLSAFFAGLLMFQSNVGVDSYEIYLNNKLVVRQSLDKPLQLQDLNLTEANATDRLSIRYSQCNAPGKTGKSRSITLRNDNGKIVKEWRFKDAEGESAQMTILVKEILEAQKISGEQLVLFYSAEGLPQGQALAAL